MGECPIRPSPRQEDWRYSHHDVFEFRKVPVVETQPAHEFPDAFDRVEFRAIGRQEMQHEVVGDRLPPWGMKCRVMVLGIVDDNHDLAASPATGCVESPEESLAGLSIKPVFGPGRHQFAVAQPDGAEVTDAFARGCMQTDRIRCLGRNPHPAARTVLLEMNFIEGPQIDSGIGG